MSAAGESVPIEIRARRTSEQRCALCHGGIGASAVACLGCQTLYHADCGSAHGRCPTLGCDVLPRARRATTAEPLVETPWAPLRRFMADTARWTRLVVVTTVLALVGLPALAGGLVGVLSLSVWSLGGVVLLGIAFLALRALDRERTFHNQVRAALAESPEVRAVLATRDRDGPRIDLREADTALAPAVPISIRPGLAGFPGWLVAAERVSVHGITTGRSGGPQTLVIADSSGHVHGVPGARVEWRRPRVEWRREDL